jgi:RND family efflux transporter MFP subunit
MSHAKSERPASSPTQNPQGGRVGLILIAGSVVAVGAWLGVRMTGASAEKKAIESQRKNTPAAVDALPEVELATLRAATWMPEVPFEGTVEAAQRAELAFKVGGRLVSVGVRLGDKVRAGQLLGRLDASEAAAQAASAQAQVSAASAQMALAEDQARRTGQLVSTGALAEATGVQAAQQRALAEAQAKGAAAQLGLVQVALSNHTLTAPFAGVVTRAPVTQGSVVGPGQALFEVVDNSALRLRGTVTEADALYVRAGAPVTIMTASGQATGRVRAVVGVLDSVTRRVPVEADLEATDAVRVGSFARATIAFGESIPVVVASGQVLRPGSQDVVVVVKDGVLEERHISFAPDVKSGELYIRSGLSLEDKVVMSPRPEARSGDRVTVAVTGAAAPPVAPTAAAPSAAVGGK